MDSLGFVKRPAIVLGRFAEPVLRVVEHAESTPHVRPLGAFLEVGDARRGLLACGLKGQRHTVRRFGLVRRTVRQRVGGRAEQQPAAYAQ